MNKKEGTRKVIGSDHRRLHWQGTKFNALIAVAILVAILLFASLFSGLFSGWNFLGFPFAFYLGAQGAFIMMIILVYWFFARQEKTDRAHGASEEI